MAGRTPLRSFLFMLLIAAMLTAGYLFSDLPAFPAGAAAALLIGLIGLVIDSSRQKQGGLSQRTPAVRSLLPPAVTAVLLLFPPLTLESDASWKYPMHKAIIGIYHNVQPSALFPDFSEDIVSDYHLSYLPGIMQGTGHFSVRFVTDPERLDSYCERFLGYMDAACLLSELSGGDTLQINDTAAYTVRYDKAFFADCPNAGVMICEAGTDPNHPHSTALIFDRGSGKLELSRLG